jgi:hypothetical protein
MVCTHATLEILAVPKMCSTRWEHPHCGTAGAAQAPEIAAAAERAVAELGLPLDMPTLLASVNSLGPEMFENLTPQLYLAFWTMELADIYVPTAE